MVLTRNEDAVKRDFFPKLKRVLANVPFAEDVVAAKRAISHARLATASAAATRAFARRSSSRATT